MTPAMSTDEPLGEVLPYHVMKELQMTFTAARIRTADRLWDAGATAAVSLFEQWRRDRA